ncbi:ATP-binding protein [Amycolatopsis sp. 195334CR]|uniref:ATP-binding protein n=1 Tax=Amycolatopsis sp. 195334CR TaxID=2814588 RepID=UPI001A901CA0|nr:ATP-binding protein [Amycolatopsis sp. 195334CR]MBN6040074.1 ATP-binding protein [Amycolatopsis sp. 195334CR]
MEPTHFLDLDGATTLVTPVVHSVEEVIHDVIAHQALGVVYGAAGTGKTFAVMLALQRYLHNHNGRRPPPTIVTLSFAHTPTLSSVARDIATALEPWASIPKTATRFQLQTRILRALAFTPYLLVVDEAQRLSSHAMEVLRYLYDDKDTVLSLLLVGGDGCWKVVSREPMLMSRLHSRRNFLPLPPEDVPTLMREFHWLYRDADPGLLTEVDTSFAHGYWRKWVSFTSAALQLAQAGDRTVLDPPLVHQVYARLGHGDD